MATLQIMLTPDDRNRIITTLKEEEKAVDKYRNRLEEIGRLDDHQGARYRSATEDFLFMEARLTGKREGISLVLGYEAYNELCKDTRLRRGADRRLLDDPNDENTIAEALRNIETYLTDNTRQDSGSVIVNFFDTGTAPMWDTIQWDEGYAEPQVER